MPLRKHALLLALLTLIQLAHTLDFVVMLPLGPRLQTELHLRPAQFAALVSAYAFSAGLVGFFGAFVIDRFDRKSALLVLFGLFTLGTGWCGLAHGFSGLMIARILAGGFGGICGSLVLAVTAEIVPPEDRGKAMGIVGAAFPIASVLGIPLAIKLAEWQGWQAPFWWLVGLAAIVWTLVLLLAPRMRGHIRPHAEVEGPVQVIRRTVGHRGQRLGLGLMATQVLGHFTLVPLLTTFLVRNVGFTVSQLPLMYLVGGLLQFGTNPLAGWLADRYGRAEMYLVYCGTATLPLLLLSHLGVVPLWQALIVTSTFFVLSGSRFIPASALLNDQVDTAHRGSYMGFVSCVQQVSSGFASYLAGWLVSTPNGPAGPLSGFETVGYVCLAFTAVSAGIGFRMRTTGVAQRMVRVEG